MQPNKPTSPTPLPTPARLAEIREMAVYEGPTGTVGHWAQACYDLLAALDAQAAEVAWLRTELAEQEAEKLELVKLLVGIGGQLRTEAVGLLTDAECEPYRSNSNGAGSRLVWNTGIDQGSCRLARLLLAAYFSKPAAGKEPDPA